MVRKSGFPWMLFFFIGIIVLSISCTPRAQLIKAEKGKMDLSSWDFDNQGIVELEGDWEFYWNVFLDHEDFIQPEKNIQPEYQHVPDLWYTYIHNTEPLPVMGFATFRLEIKLPDKNRIYSFKLFDMSTAYSLYVDGNYIMGNGTPGTDKNESIPQWKSQTGLCVPESDTIEIIVHVSNYHFTKPGFWKSLFFGPEENISSHDMRAKAWVFFILGIYLAIGLYHLILFFLGRNDKSTLFFGIFCLFFAIRSICTGERIIFHLFPWINWHAGILLEYTSIYCCVIFFIFFLKSLYPEETNKVINWIIILTTIIFIVIFIVLPTHLTTAAHSLYSIFMLLILVYIIIVLILASIRGKVGALFLVIGFFFFGITVFYDLLASEFIINFNFLSPIGILFFILTEFALYIKFIKAEEELREREKELLQAEKLASLGTLIAGVAHEINNPNSSISLTASTLINIWNNMEQPLDEYVENEGDFYVGSSMYSDIKEDIPDSLKRILRNSQRIKVIVKDLKDYAKKDESDAAQAVDINKVITSSLHLLENLIKKSTSRFKTILADNLPKVKGNPQRLEQVILNIIQNACQALSNPEQGIFIETKYDEGTRKVLIKIKDEGIGMDRKTRTQIFDPFFTTKRANGGTGLGMAVSARIIHNHGGKLKIKSKPEKGTTVSITLDIIEETK